MTSINYVKGNALEPQGDGNKLIIHCCNDIGGWGSGFVVAISKMWTRPEEKYREWYKNGGYHSPADNMYKVAELHDDMEKPYPAVHHFHLGQIQVVPVNKTTSIVNMIGQRATGIASIRVGDEVIELPPVRYESIRECCYRVADYALRNNCSVHAPRICCGLARGKWEIVEEILENCLCSRGIPVTIYDIG